MSTKKAFERKNSSVKPENGKNTNYHRSLIKLMVSSYLLQSADAKYDPKKTIEIQQKTRSISSLCILSGEIGRHKKSAENLFPLPICVIMV